MVEVLVGGGEQDQTQEEAPEEEGICFPGRPGECREPVPACCQRERELNIKQS